MRFRAVNEEAHAAQVTSTGETQEAREARIISSYEQALRCIAEGNNSDALVSLI